MRIAVLGTGFHGLVLSTCLAENGHQVCCIDSDAARVTSLNEGKLLLHEPGLEELLVRNLEEERLEFSTDLAQAISNSLMIMLCIETQEQESGLADLSAIYAAAERIAEHMDDYRIVVNKCTCPPGTADEIQRIIAAHTEYPVDVVVNPDFLKEGAAVDDFMRPDRVVVGCDGVQVREIMKELYAPFLRTNKPFLFMSPRAAELTKYAVNLMLAARISMMNQLADLCQAYEVDLGDVRGALACDERIGSAYLFPGIGFGGPHLPKDLATCIQLAQDKGVESDLFEAVQAVNIRRQEQFLKMVLDHYGDQICNIKLAVWGASFKARTDDMRGAPSRYCIDRLLEAGATVSIYDPAARKCLTELYGDRIHVAKKYYEVLEEADGLLIFTEWNEFRRPDYDRMGKLMRQKVIFDGKNLYTPKIMKEHGFRYFSVGRQPV